MRLTKKQVESVFEPMVKNKTKALKLINQSFSSEEIKQADQEDLEAKNKQMEWQIIWMVCLDLNCIGL
ncbi:hypothetical protein [Marinifilum sp. D737]|uniref:hypothetical protein n=1 Tax=Marinifilum sp. D737 TaxID=2969628 RepID=UPI002276D46D|nr:hypothetical protein [Marinifilum sp. D737]MCY1634995.1 hypothetical protein [Marinifilum sp. D737]